MDVVSMFVIPALRKQRQEDLNDSRLALNSIVKPRLKQTYQKTNQAVDTQVLNLRHANSV